MDWLDGEKFEALALAYRNAPGWHPPKVAEHLEQLREFIRVKCEPAPCTLAHCTTACVTASTV